MKLVNCQKGHEHNSSQLYLVIKGILHIWVT